MAAGTIQGQTMQGQQRTRNFFPIQVFASFYFHKNLIHAGGQRVMEPWSSYSFHDLRFFRSLWNVLQGERDPEDHYRSLAMQSLCNALQGDTEPEDHQITSASSSLWSLLFLLWSFMDVYCTLCRSWKTKFCQHIREWVICLAPGNCRMNIS